MPVINSKVYFETLSSGLWAQVLTLDTHEGRVLILLYVRNDCGTNMVEGELLKNSIL